MKKDFYNTAIDCFAGCGGLSLGLRNAGFEVVYAFDNAPNAVATYSRNLGSHVQAADVATISESRLRELVDEHGEISLVAGGPPCQGFSRQRRGPSKDQRNELIFEFLRIVDVVRPSMFLMENVSGIGSKRGMKHLPKLLDDAGALGYLVQTKVLNAADFGVPQNRKRMFIVGELATLGPGRFVFPKPTHDASEYVTVGDAIADLPAPGAGSSNFHNHQPDNISDLNRLRISHVPPGGGRDDIPEELRLPCHKRSADEIGHRSVYGRLAWDSPSGTITTKCNSFTRGRFAHPSQDRNITMREAARLQSFPDEFKFEGDKVSVAHQIGNAVPPILAEQLGRAVLAAIGLRCSGEEVIATSGQRHFTFD